MGAYDNPQAVRMKIDQGARNIAQFFTSMKGVTENIQRQAAVNKKEAEKATAKKDRAKREKDAREGRALGNFDKQYAHIESLVDQIGGDFDAGEGKNVQDDAIMENLIAMRDKFLSDISSPDLGAAEISQIQAKYDNRIATFKQDMDNFIGGYRVYKDIKDKDLGPNEEDAILSDETAPFNEMIPIYESIYNKKGNVGIYPSADGNSFNIGKFNKGKRENEAGEVLTGSSLTEYRKYAQKDGPNKPAKFFEQVEIYAPGNGSRIDFVTNTMGKLKNTDYDIVTSLSEPKMVKNKEGKLVEKMKVGKRPNPDNPTGPLIQVMVPDVDEKTILNAEKLKEFRNTKEGVNYLLSSLGEKNPRAVYAGFGYPSSTYSQDALLDAIVLDLEQTYNKSTTLIDENIGSEEDTFENIDNPAGQGGYLS